MSSTSPTPGTPPAPDPADRSRAELGSAPEATAPWSSLGGSELCARFFEATNDAVLLLDPQGRIRAANAAAAHMHGYSVAEMTALCISDLDTSESAHLAPGRLSRILAGEPLVFEVAHRRRDGSAFPVEVVASRIQVDGENLVLAFDRDITSRKETEDARDRLLALLQATIESTTDGILVIDSTGRIQSFNRLFAEMWRIPPEVLATRDDNLALQHALTQLVDPEAFLHHVQELYSRPHEESFDTLQFKDGRIIERYSRPQFLSGAPAGRVWSFRDVTDRVRAEARRTALEASLIQAKKMEALGTLAGGVAHDFNNLLGGISGFLEVARNRLPPEHPASGALSQAIAIGGQARDLVRQILTFSRQTTPELIPLDVADTVHAALDVARFALPATAEVRTALAPGCPAIAADRVQFQQVVLNLCTNAAQALPDQGGRITVTVAPAQLPPQLAATHPALTSLPLVLLSVSDNGVGMDPATLERIFEPFFTTKEPGKGTGLGLAVVHGIVGAHGGAIDVHSQPGIGTTFDLYFPALAAAAPAPPAETTAGAPIGHRELVLWVDDNPATGAVIEYLLTRLGFLVRYCPDPNEALAMFTAAPASFAMLITDLEMPDLDGEALAKRVLAVRPDLPVLVVTGMIASQRAAALLAAGIREIVLKPVTEAQLGRVVARHLPAASRA